MTPKLPPRCATLFRSVNLLASGGYGDVILAHQLGLDRQVVVKLLHASALSSKDDVARFVNEARITARLKHPNIVVLIDHAIEDGLPWIAYEYVPGADLRHLVADGPMEPKQAARAMAQVAAALAEAHRHGVVHRDIKPDNVIQVTPDRYKVTDFGIAKWAAAEVKTASGVILGTPAYISPEQILGEPVAESADIYAAGVMLYELLTGQVPFGGDSIAQILQRHVQSAPPLPSALVPGLGRGFDEVVRTAMAKKPIDRFAGATELQQALERLGGAVDAPSPALRPRPKPAGAAAIATLPARRPPVPPPVARQTSASAAATIIAVLLVGGAAAVYRAPRPSPVTPVGSTVAAPAPSVLRQLPVSRPDPQASVRAVLKKAAADAASRSWPSAASGYLQIVEGTSVPSTAADVEDARRKLIDLLRWWASRTAEYQLAYARLIEAGAWSPRGSGSSAPEVAHTVNELGKRWAIAREKLARLDTATSGSPLRSGVVEELRLAKQAVVALEDVVQDFKKELRPTLPAINVIETLARRGDAPSAERCRQLLAGSLDGFCNGTLLALGPGAPPFQIPATPEILATYGVEPVPYLRQVAADAKRLAEVAERIGSPRSGELLRAALALHQRLALESSGEAGCLVDESQILEHLGERPRAIQLLNTCLNAHPKDITAQAWIARLYGRSNLWKEAALAYENLLALQPRTDADLYRREYIAALLYAHDWAKALAQYKGAVKTASPEAWTRLRRELAERSVQAAVTVNGEAEILHLWSLARDAVDPGVDLELEIARHLEACGHHDAFKRFVEDLESRHPRRPEVLVLKAFVLAHQRECRAAFDVMTNAVRLAPDRRVIAREWGNLVQRLRVAWASSPAAPCMTPVEQLRLIRNWVEGSPDEALAHAELANRLTDTDPAEAELHYRAAVLHAPDASWAHSSLAVFLHWHHNGDRARLMAAVTEMERAVKIDPGQADFLFELGEVCALAGLLDRAVKAHGEGLRISPTNMTMRAKRARYLAALGRLEESETDLRLVLAAPPGDAELHEVLAAAALDLAARKAERHDLGAAIKLLEDTLRVCAGAPDVIRVLGEYRSRSGPAPGTTSSAGPYLR